MTTQPADTKRIIIELVATILVPIVAIPLAVIHFVRERVGAGLGLLLTACAASAIWFAIIFAVALHNTSHESTRYQHEAAKIEQQVAAGASRLDEAQEVAKATGCSPSECPPTDINASAKTEAQSCRESNNPSSRCQALGQLELSERPDDGAKEGSYTNEEGYTYKDNEHETFCSDGPKSALPSC